MENKILITGTDGFIGSTLKNYFLQEGFQVFGTTYYRSPNDEREIQFDITEKQDFTKLWKDEIFDTIIHTIGNLDQTKSKKLLIAVNALGTKSMCEYAKNHNCKHFIFTSSVAVYGFKSLGENLTESTIKSKFQRLFPPYGRSKAMAEKYIEKSGLPYTILRLPMVLGRGDTFISNSIIPRLIEGSIFTCGKAKKKISILYVKNIGPIIEKLVKVGPLNKSFNCVSNTLFWDEFVKQFAIELNVEYKPKKKPASLIFNYFKDKDYQFIATYSAYGAHYDSTSLLKYLNGDFCTFNWKNGVKEAIMGYIDKKM